MFRVSVGDDGSGGIGALGVDLQTREGQLSQFALRRGERIRVADGVLSRAPGTKRLAVLTNNTGSYTFGATTKYATFTPPLIPKGGFAVLIHFYNNTPSAGRTGWVVGSRPAGQTYHVFKATWGLPFAGTRRLTVAWRDSAGADHTITVDTVDTGVSEEAHVLAVYDAVAGTFTVYLNGTSVGTPETGLASTLQPAQDAGVVWTFGVEKETGQAVTANSQLPGRHDGMTLFTLRGTRPASGSPSLIDTLKAHSFREWPNPSMPFVLAHYDMNEPSGTVMYDRSRHKNHGTYVGAVSTSAAVARSFPVGNYCGVFQSALGARTNLVAAGGQLFYEQTKAGA